MTAAQPQEPLLHWLAVKDEDEWVIHCLDFDIAAQGRMEAEARQNLIHAIEMLYEQALEDGTPDGIFQSAPQALWDTYVKAQGHKSGQFNLNIRKPLRGSVPTRARTEERVSLTTSAA
jgi:predicted RNase H-like HicB family nuclease